MLAFMYLLHNPFSFHDQNTTKLKKFTLKTYRVNNTLILSHSFFHPVRLQYSYDAGKNDHPHTLLQLIQTP